MDRHLMSPPEEQEERRGLMAPDPTLASDAPALRSLLWCVAGLVLLVELLLKALA